MNENNMTHFEYLFLGYYLGDNITNDIDIKLKEKVQDLSYITLSMGTQKKGDSVNYTSEESNLTKFLPIIEHFLENKTFDYIYLPLFGFKYDFDILVFLLRKTKWLFSPTQISKKSIRWYNWTEQNPLVGNKNHWYVTKGTLEMPFRIKVNPKFEKCLKNIARKTGSNMKFIKKLVEENEFSVEYPGWEKLRDKLFMLSPTNSPDFDKIAAFDMDNTLTYAENHLYPSDPDDVHLLPDRLRVLNEFARKGYRILLFTNQKAKSYKTVQKRLTRVRNFIRKVNVPITAFVSSGDYVDVESSRKPGIGAWRYFLEHATKYKNSEVIFCGDALGRPGDFSDSDKKFAENVRDVLEQKVTIVEPENLFAPQKIAINLTNQPLLILTVGAPGTGKSHFANEVVRITDEIISNNLLAETSTPFVRINKDDMKSKWLKNFKQAVQDRSNIIVDNTNASFEDRLKLYELAQGYKYIVVYFVNDGRRFNSQRDKPIPTIVYHMYFKKLNSPRVYEGFHHKDKNVDVYIVEGQNVEINITQI